MTVHYSQDFAAGNTDNWRATYLHADGSSPSNTYLAHRSDDDGSVASGNAYWPDCNHLSYGIGKIGLVAWNYVATMGLGSFEDWCGAVVSLRLKAALGFYMPRYSRLVWWMQRADPANPAKSWNMCQSGVPIDREMGFGDGGLRANTRLMDTDWECYGAAPGKVQYSCPKSPVEFLSGPMINCGLHLILYDSYPPLNIGGELRISRIKIETP